MDRNETVNNSDLVQFSCSVLSDSLWPHLLQHSRPPCSSPTPGVDPNACPLSWWFHLAISSSVVCFSSHLQSVPTSGSLQISQLFASGVQSTGVSALASVLPINTNEISALISFSMDWLDLLGVQGILKTSPTPQFKNIHSSVLRFLYSPTFTSIHDYWRNHSFK